MGKFVIKCPHCADNGEDVYVSANSGLFGTGLFASRKINCPKGHVIDVKTDRMAVKVCPHCGNNVVYDQSKGEKATCPVCKTEINTLNDLVACIDIKCPQCGCLHTVSKDAESMDCPVCDTHIDVQREIGKKKMREQNAVSLIKYEGGNDVFVWKHPIEDFKMGSQLIVHESQEALFFAGGEALDLFPGGTYTLSTENIPLLGSVYKLPSGDGSFHSEVYFINKTTHTGIKWGTSDRVKLFDPVSGMHVGLGAFGSFNIKVSDSKRLVLKLVGTTDIFSHSSNLNADAEGAPSDSKVSTGSKNILNYIKSIIVSKVRVHFANVIKANGWSVLEIDAHTDELAAGIKEKINLDLEEYGLTLPDFIIMNISTPEDSDDPQERADYLRMKRQFGERYLNVTEEQNKAAVARAAQERKIIEAETAARMKIIEAQGTAESDKLKGFAEAEVMRAQGYNAKDRMSFEVQKTFAENIGNIGGSGGSALGDLVGLGAGLGMMSKVGGQVAGMMNFPAPDAPVQGGNVPQAAPAAPTPDTWDCECGNKGIVGGFCNMCGKPKPVPVAPDTWDCECGNKGIVGKFCNMCGKPRPVPAVPDTWDCECGNKGIVGRFCNMCGKPRP